MTNNAYRDDLEAALARASDLEGEVEELQRRKAELEPDDRDERQTVQRLAAAVEREDAKRRWRLVTTPAEKRNVSIILGWLGGTMAVGALAAGGFIGAAVIAIVTGGLVWLLRRDGNRSPQLKAPADGFPITTAYRGDLDAARLRVGDLERQAEALRTGNSALEKHARQVVEAHNAKSTAIQFFLAKTCLYVGGIAAFAANHGTSTAFDVTAFVFFSLALLFWGLSGWRRR
jgi:hypothetical protein